MNPDTDARRMRRLEQLPGERTDRLWRLLERMSAVPWEADARDWRFTYVGPQAPKLLGYARERWYEPDFWRSRLHPDDRDLIIAFRSGSCRKREDYEAEYRMIGAGGAAVWIRELGGVSIAPDRPTVLQGLLFDVSASRRAEEIIRHSEARYRAIIEDQTEFIVRWSPDTTRTFVNDAYCRFFGKPRDELIGTSFLPLVAEEDRPQILQKIRNLRPDNPVAVDEHRAVRPDGSGCWQQWSDRGIFDETGRLIEIQSVGRDITDKKIAEDALRKLSGRLIRAQEEERGHLARELHDGLNQSLALLAVELDLLAASTRDLPPAFADGIRNLSGQVKELSTEVDRLSHRLHPAKLEQLGLVAAVGSECEEISRQHRIDVRFTHRHVPQAMGDDVALCLYRICQESLQNAVRHSGAKTVGVQIAGRHGWVRLRVRDSGRGFEPGDPGSTAGLGLIGMRERVRLVNGRFTIDSGPGRGTRIDVEVPVTRPHGGTA